MWAHLRFSVRNLYHQSNTVCQVHTWLEMRSKIQPVLRSAQQLGRCFIIWNKADHKSNKTYNHMNSVIRPQRPNAEDWLMTVWNVIIYRVDTWTLGTLCLDETRQDVLLWWLFNVNFNCQDQKYHDTDDRLPALGHKSDLWPQKGIACLQPHKNLVILSNLQWNMASITIVYRRLI